MRVIIAGGRDFADYEAVKEAVVASGFEVTEVVSGDYRGADGLGRRWARENKVRVRPFPAAWAKYGKSAGPKRNEQMAAYADALIAMPGGRGTADMVARAKAHGLQIFRVPA